MILQGYIALKETFDFLMKKDPLADATIGPKKVKCLSNKTSLPGPSFLFLEQNKFSKNFGDPWDIFHQIVQNSFVSSFSLGKTCLFACLKHNHKIMKAKDICPKFCNEFCNL